MSYSTYRGQTSFRGFGMGSGAPAPRDLIVILVVLFVTFSLQFFAATAMIPRVLRLSPAVFAGWLWQLVTYPFVGFGGASLWFLLELLILFWFGRDVFWRLGRRRFWQQLAWGVIGAALAAAVVELVLMLAHAPVPPSGPFLIMQGQRTLMAIMIAAFATLYGDATILLFFVIPVRARWFLWLEILFAFIAFLNTKDFPGFVGICAAVGITYSTLAPGGPRQQVWRWRRTFEKWLYQIRLARSRRRRPFGVIDGDKDRWVH